MVGATVLLIAQTEVSGDASVTQSNDNKHLSASEDDDRQDTSVTAREIVPYEDLILICQFSHWVKN